MFYLYPIISWLYLLIPVVVGSVAIGYSRHTGKMWPLRTFFRSCITGTFLGGAVTTTYAAVVGVHPPPLQVAAACYLGIASLLVVTGLNWLLYHGVSRLFRIKPRAEQKPAGTWAQAAAGIVQAALLVVIGLPYLGSILLLYRPKAPSPGDPLTLIDAGFESVQLRATDGIRLDAWWVPATRNTRTDGRGSHKQGHDTVLLCHGFGRDKASDLFLARDLVANGYNLLAIDLRAHGRSGGQFTGFGGIESRDVLGAVNWLRTNHPSECRRILGLGESLGAVALIEAASDPGPDGRAIDAIAAYNPYDELSPLINNVAAEHTIAAGPWVLKHIIVPVASIQLGANLSTVDPAIQVQRLWPRPILVLGNPSTRRPGGAGSYELFRNALQPKYSYWRDDADRETLLHDDTAALTVRIFFDEERSIL
jgi:pimeloyl-ACP methyl ester carboxylesterase